MERKRGKDGGEVLFLTKKEYALLQTDENLYGKICCEEKRNYVRTPEGVRIYLTDSREDEESSAQITRLMLDNGFPVDD